MEIKHRQIKAAAIDCRMEAVVVTDTVKQRLELLIEARERIAELEQSNKELLEESLIHREQIARLEAELKNANQRYLGLRHGNQQAANPHPKLDPLERR